MNEKKLCEMYFWVGMLMFRRGGGVERERAAAAVVDPLSIFFFTASAQGQRRDMVSGAWERPAPRRAPLSCQR